jgi:hemolysin activation/secretion protein
MKGFVIVALAALLWTVAAAPARAADPAAEEGEQFAIRGFDIMGNSVLSPSDADAAVAPFAGRRKTSGDVEKARDALESLFHDRGYPTVLVNIPEQAVEGGRIRLQVVEGRVGKLAVKGNRFVTTERIVALVPSLSPGRVVYIPAVQADLAKVNAIPDVRAVPSMTPSAETGIVDVALTVEDARPVHGSVEVSNRAGLDTTPMRVNASLRYDDLWSKRHSAAVQAQLSPQDLGEVVVLNGSYVMPLPEESDRRLAFYAVKSNSDVGFGEGFKILGKGYVLGARYSVPLPPVGRWYHSASVGADWKSFDETVEGVTTRVTYLPFSATWGGSRADIGGTTQMSASLSFPLRGVVTDEEEFAGKRFKARGSYAVAGLGAERRQALPRRFTLYAKLEGQVASQPLVSNEQFSAGGMESVRGYREGETSGDDAVRATLELLAPPVMLPGGRKGSVLPFLFADGAFLWTRDPLPGQADEAKLAGAGLGIRGAAGSSIDFEADAAFALSDTDRTESGGFRVHARIRYQF